MSSPVCSSPMCSEGRALVREMWAAFNYLVANYQTFEPAKFEPSASAIQAALDAADYWYADWIPFNPTCCTLLDIGNQAQVLTDQMLQSVGAASLPIPPQSGTNWLGVAVVVGVVALGLMYAPQIKSAIGNK